MYKKAEEMKKAACSFFKEQTASLMFRALSVDLYAFGFSFHNRKHGIVNRVGIPPLIVQLGFEFVQGI